MNAPSKEELWLLCLKGNCTYVNDIGLEILQKYFCDFVKNILSICFTLATHESRTVITCRDVIHSQEVMFRQRENATIRMSGYLLNTAMTDDDDDDDDDSSRMSTGESHLEAASSDEDSDSSNQESDENDNDDAVNRDEEKQLRQRQSQEQRSEMRRVIEVEDENDINAIEYNPSLKSTLTSKLISLRSYLQLFKDISPTKFISVDAFNMMTGVCEHQVQLNLLGRESLVQVVFDGMIVPIKVMMKLSQQAEEQKTVSLASKFLAVEKECLSSLTLARSHQKELLGVLRRLAITSSSSSSSAQQETAAQGFSHHSQANDEIYALQHRLLEEQTTTSFLKEQLQESRTAVHSLQDVLKGVNEVAFSLRALTSPRPRSHTTTAQVQTSDASLSCELKAQL